MIGCLWKMTTMIGYNTESTPKRFDEQLGHINGATRHNAYIINVYIVIKL